MRFHIQHLIEIMQFVDKIQDTQIQPFTVYRLYIASSIGIIIQLILSIASHLDGNITSRIYHLLLGNLLRTYISVH